MHWRNWRTRSGRSACCSRWSSARSCPGTTRSSWASGGGAPASGPGSVTSRRSSGETSDDDLLRDALIENLHREQLNPLEEAAAYQQLLDDFGATHEELAQRVGRSRPHISNTLRLLALPAGRAARVAAGVLSAGHARALLAVQDPQAQEQLARRIVAEGLSVRAVEEIVALGAQPARPPRQSPARPSAAPMLREFADRLSDAFETRVKVELGQRKGKIVVEFASLEDLERIVKTMTPDWAHPQSA